MDQILIVSLNFVLWLWFTSLGLMIMFHVLDKIKRYITPFPEVEDWYRQFYCEIEGKVKRVSLTRKQMRRINQTPVETIKDLNRITKMSNKEYKEYRFARRI